MLDTTMIWSIYQMEKWKIYYSIVDLTRLDMVTPARVYRSRLKLYYVALELVLILDQTQWGETLGVNIWFIYNW